jgi:hypothetical protein
MGRSVGILYAHTSDLADFPLAVFALTDHLIDQGADADLIRRCCEWAMAGAELVAVVRLAGPDLQRVRAQAESSA